MKLFLTVPKTLGILWPKAAPLLEPAVDLNPGWEIDDVLQAVATGNAYLWVVVDGEEVKAAAVCLLIEYPRIRSCLILFVGGEEVHLWKHYLDDIKKWAKSCKCSQIEGAGRKGWAKIRPDMEVGAYYSINLEG